MTDRSRKDRGDPPTETGTEEATVYELPVEPETVFEPHPSPSEHPAPDPEQRGPTRSFGPGHTLAGRYRIVRFIAEGGMGEVFEAEDLELSSRIALKTVRHEKLADPGVAARFRREIQLARQVTHRNVCRIFDLVREEGDGASRDAALFLTMELLHGETLSARLWREGALTPDEALPLVRQMVAALAAAHDAEIVHRDFKTGNVLLEPEEDGGTRLVVTDFGIAQSMTEPEVQLSLTATGMLLGTPAYMAPEQVEGKEVGPAADIYALGVVLYELMTGRVPFQGTTPLAVAVSRLTKPVPDPKKLVPNLDARWKRVILRCLARRPEDRFASVRDVVRSLEGELPARPGRRARWLVGAAVASVLAAGLFFVFSLGREAPPSPPTAVEAGALPAVTARTSVAVVGFRNLSGSSDSAWLSTALTQMMSMELALGEELRVIPDESVARMRTELGLEQDSVVSEGVLARIRGNLGTDLVVLGSFVTVPSATGRDLRLDLRLADAASGETLAAISRTGPQEDLLTLVTGVGEELRSRLGVSPQTGRERAELPADPEAARAYAEGLAALHRFDFLAARDSLERAVELAGDTALPYSALAQALIDLGLEAEATEAARRAFELSADQPREQRYLIEGRYREVAGEWDAAVAVYQRLFGFFPDSVDYGLRLENALLSSGRIDEAEAVLDQLESLPTPSAEDPRIDLAAVHTADARGNFQDLQAAADLAATKAQSYGARLIQAEARSLEAWAWVFLGRPDEGLESALEARGIYSELGHRAGLANALGSMAPILSMQGRHREAAALSRQATEIHFEIGNRSQASNGLQNVLFDALNVGDAVGARAVFEELAPLVDELQLGAMLEIHVEYLEGWLLFLEGRLEEALAIERRVFARFVELEDKRRIGQGHRRIGDILFALDRVEEARDAFAESVRIPSAIGLEWYVGQNRVPLALAELELGNLDQAAENAREALKIFDSVGSVDRAAEARAALALALVAKGEDTAAAAMLVPALEEWAELENLRVRAFVAIAALEVTPGPATAQRGATRHAEATDRGSIEAMLLTRLALDRYDLQAGAAADRRALDSLVEEARKRSFNLIARRAEAAFPD